MGPYRTPFNTGNAVKKPKKCWFWHNWVCVGKENRAGTGVAYPNQEVDYVLKFECSKCDLKKISSAFIYYKEFKSKYSIYTFNTKGLLDYQIDWEHRPYDSSLETRLSHFKKWEGAEIVDGKVYFKNG